MSVHARPRPAIQSDSGFTLVELVIAIVLSSIVAGVTVAVLITSMNVVNSTNDVSRDATDAGLIAAFLYRDAQAAGGTDPVTLAELSGLGVSTADWGGCEQDGDLVVRFSWIDRDDASVDRPMTVTWARLADGTLMRRACQDGAVVDALLGEHIAAATVTCRPGPGCDADTTAVDLVVTGSAARSATTITLTSNLRTDQASLTPVAGRSGPLVLVADAASGGRCPKVTLEGARTVVLGDAIVDAACGVAGIDGDLTTLQPTGQIATTSVVGDPYAGSIPAPPTCTSGPSTSVGGTTVYPSAVSFRGQATLGAGRHVFCRGVTVEDGAVVDGTDVFIQVVSGDVVVAAGATINLSAPTRGAYANLLVATAGGSFRFTGGAGPDVLRGVVYAPTASVEVSTESSVAIGALVSAQLVVSGSGTVRFGTPIPTITMQPATLPAGQVGVAYASTALIADGATGPYTWRASGLPGGLSLTTGGLLTGWPNAAGTTIVTLTAIDATGLAARFDRAVTVRAAPSIASPASLPSGQVGAAYTTTTVTATGGASPFSFSASGLPAGLSISSAGVISGTPTTAATSSASVRVTDAIGATASRNYQVTVIAGVAISSPAALPGGTVGTAYTSTTVTATGGTAPYVFAASGLPAGLNISAAGVITGTPTTAATYAVTVRATDGAGAGASRTYNVVVSNAPSAGSAAPFAAANGFQVFVEGSTNLATWDIWGAAATGGDLTFRNYQRIATHGTSTLTVHSNGKPLGLLIGGKANLTTSGSGSELSVATGWFAVGSITGQSLLTFSTELHLVPAGVTDDYTTPRLVAEAGQGGVKTGDPVKPGAFTFDTAFTTLRKTSEQLAGLSSTSCSSIATPTVGEAYGNHTIKLSPGMVNVWNLTVAEMERIKNLDAPNLPGGDTELIINITDAGAVVLPVRYWKALENQTQADSVMWNFPNASSVTVTQSFLGSLLAPNAAVTMYDANIDGDVVAKSLDFRPWTAELARFDVKIPCLGV